MEKPSLREIEITVISCEGLLVNRKQPVKKNTFVVIRSEPFHSVSKSIDKEGGSYPAWNEKLLLQLPAHARFITVEAHSGSKLVGKENIPVSDFSGVFLPENHLSFLSYRLRDDNGEKNAIVNLSVKVKGETRRGCADSCSGLPWEGIAAVDGKESDDGIVTGIPVPYRY